MMVIAVAETDTTAGGTLTVRGFKDIWLTLSFEATSREDFSAKFDLDPAAAHELRDHLNSLYPPLAPEAPKVSYEVRGPAPVPAVSSSGWRVYRVKDAPSYEFVLEAKTKEDAEFCVKALEARA